jgi:hypothetical protein
VAAIVAAVLVNVFSNVPSIVVAGWIALGASLVVLLARGARWLVRQQEAVQIEHEADVLLDREPVLAPLHRPPRWGEHYDKAS